jgi:hypothetical protein
VRSRILTPPSRHFELAGLIALALNAKVKDRFQNGNIDSLGKFIH